MRSSILLFYLCFSISAILIFFSIKIETDYFCLSIVCHRSQSNHWRRISPWDKHNCTIFEWCQASDQQKSYPSRRFLIRFVVNQCAVIQCRHTHTQPHTFDYPSLYFTIWTLNTLKPIQSHTQTTHWIEAIKKQNKNCMTTATGDKWTKTTW